MNVAEFKVRAKRLVWIESYARLALIAGSLSLLTPLFYCYESVLSFGLVAYSVLVSIGALIFISSYYYFIFSSPVKSGLVCKECGWKFIPHMGAWSKVELIVASKSCPSCGKGIVSVQADPSNKPVHPSADAPAD